MQGLNITMFVARNVAFQRKKAGLTQAEVAERIFVEKETVSRMESGRISLGLERLQQLADLFGCAVTDFFREPSSNVEHQAASIIDMLRPLAEDERKAILHFIGDAVRIFRKKGSML